MAIALRVWKLSLLCVATCNISLVPLYNLNEWRCIQKCLLFQVTKRAIRAINPNNDRPLHVSFDIDALDPAESPATGTPGIKHCFAIIAQQLAYSWRTRPTYHDPFLYISSSWGTVFEGGNVSSGGVLQERVLDCLGHCRGQLGPGSGGISEETGPANNTFQQSDVFLL